jgi:hypothetical protein
MTTARRSEELAIASASLLQVVVSLLHARRAWVDEFVAWAAGQGIDIPGAA